MLVSIESEVITVNINQRIRHLRKSVLGLNQRQFASDLGMAQTGVSGMEQDGATVTDRVIKSICLTYGINEEWLRNGTGPMQVQNNSFDLSQFVEDRGGSQLDFEILKAYFTLPKDIRNAVIEHFRKCLTSSPSSPAPVQSVEDLEEEYKKRHSASASTTTSNASSITTDAEKAAGEQ